MKYQILQLPIEDDLVFRDWDKVKTLGLTPSELLKRYKIVYEGELEGESATQPTIRVLEELFRIFNIDHPEDYRARSLSNSDVVALCDGDGNPSTYWFCDSWGWEEIK